MKLNTIAGLAALALLAPTGLAHAGSAELSLDWQQCSLTMSSGRGSLLGMGDGVSVDAIIVTDHSGIEIGGGYPEWESHLGQSSAGGRNGFAKAVIGESGQSQVFAGSSNAAVIDLAPGAHGVFRVPYAYLLDTMSAGDVSASTGYSFINTNYQLDGIETVPTTTTRGRFDAAAGQRYKGRGFIDILLDNPTDKLLRFSLQQDFSASAVAAAVPEPATYASFLIGLGVLGWRARRRQAPGTGRAGQA